MTEPPVHLRRFLGRGDVLAVAFGAMVGWSWVVLAGEMIVRAGAVGSILAFGAGAVMVWLVGLTYAELSAALSRAGGELSFTFLAMGPLGAFVCGWTLVLAYAAVCAFEAVALPTVLGYLVPGFGAGDPLYTVAGWDVQPAWVAAGVAGALVIGVVNYRGIRFAAFVQQMAVGGLLLVGLAFFLPGSRARRPRQSRTGRHRLGGGAAGHDHDSVPLRRLRRHPAARGGDRPPVPDHRPHHPAVDRDGLRLVRPRTVDGGPVARPPAPSPIGPCPPPTP